MSVRELVYNSVEALIGAMTQTTEAEDNREHYLLQEIAVLDRLSTSMAAKAANSKPSTTCPYCQMHELAGHARNLLDFVRRECHGDQLGPATGGTIPLARRDLQTVATISQGTDARENLIPLLAQIDPMLEHIRSCAEAEQVSRLSEDIWLATAKAAQTFFANGPSG